MAMANFFLNVKISIKKLLRKMRSKEQIPINLRVITLDKNISQIKMINSQIWYNYCTKYHKLQQN